MKLTLFLLGLTALVSAAPKANNLSFRNVYKKPLVTENRPHSRIINGQEAAPHTIPYIAFMEINSETGGWYCGGSLISTNYVVSAGHCGYEAVEAYILLGAHTPQQKEDTQVLAYSRDITVHENYNDDTLENDISVFRLDSTVTPNNVIQVIPLPGRNDASNDFTGVTAKTSGWGLTDGKGTTISNVLMFIDVNVISNTECSNIFGDLSNAYLCTSGADNTGTCNGDSGGPLVTNGVLIGVTSFGVEDCELGYPSGYARVTTYLDWLASKTDVTIA